MRKVSTVYLMQPTITSTTRLWVTLACVFGFALFGSVQAVCEGRHELKSSSINLVLDGTTATFTPLKNGEETFPFFNLSFTLAHVYEKARDYSDERQEYYCDWGTDSEDPALQRFSTDDFNCEITSFTTNPMPGVSLRQVDINFTHPDYPNWYILNSWYASNQTFEIVPSTNTTYVDPSQNYTWKFEASFVQLYWNWLMSIVDTSVTFVDDAYEFRGRLEHEGDVMVINFEKGFMFDGAAYFQPDPTKLGPFLNFSKSTFTLPLQSGVPLCVPVHYDEAIYDPSISTLFSSPVANVPGQDPKNSKKAVIVGAVVGSLAAMVVITIATLTIFVPSVRHFFRPFSKPRTTTSASKDTTHDTQSSTKGWARSTTPAQP